MLSKRYSKGKQTDNTGSVTLCLTENTTATFLVYKVLIQEMQNAAHLTLLSAMCTFKNSFIIFYMLPRITKQDNSNPYLQTDSDLTLTLYQ